MLTIQKLAMINCHPSHTTDELKVREVIFVTQARVWIYLEGVIIPVKTNHIYVILLLFHREIIYLGK